jgi:hypothetical protein
MSLTGCEPGDEPLQVGAGYVNCVVGGEVRRTVRAQRCRKAGDAAPTLGMTTPPQQDSATPDRKFASLLAK